MFSNNVHVHIVHQYSLLVYVACSIFSSLLLLFSVLGSWCFLACYFVLVCNNINYNNFYGAVARPYRYQGTSPWELMDINVTYPPCIKQLYTLSKSIFSSICCHRYTIFGKQTDKRKKLIIVCLRNRTGYRFKTNNQIFGYHLTSLLGSIEKHS